MCFEYYPHIEGPSRQAGYSLLELSVVVLIVGIMAAAVIPTFSSSQAEKLNLVAEGVAQAIRFAHSESLRSGEYYGVTISQVTQRITVKKWNINTDPVSTESIPYHPVNKQSFEFEADSLSLASGVSISNTSDIFLYDSIGRRRSLIFDPQGSPIWIMNLTERYRLLDATITLDSGDDQRQVIVAPLTGQVSIQ